MAWWIYLILWWHDLCNKLLLLVSSSFVCVIIQFFELLFYCYADCEFNFACRPNQWSKSFLLIQNNEFDDYLLALLLFDCISFVLAKTARELVASILHPNCSYFVVLLYEFQFIHIAPSYYGKYQITFFYFTTIYSLYFSWYSYYFMYF